ncbi:unnamed protein product [Cercospora beticola]|nr:unnamed protein product [Cercospora beticola]
MKQIGEQYRMEKGMTEYDVIVVGAGIGGLSAAKTYLQLAPQANVLIFESRPTLGGVWCEQNLYEGLKTNNLLSTYEFSDWPMDPKKYDVQPGKHIPGKVMFEYLNDYAKHFNIFGKILFRTEVREVEKLEDGWRVTAESDVGDIPIRVRSPYRTKKLIMATGLASKPNPVRIPGVEDFDKPVLHHGDLKDRAQELANDPNVKKVTVIGASKIGYDAVFLFASHGKKVDWIVRKSGGGAVWMAQPWVKMGPWKVMLEHIACMRFFSWFSPCSWGDYDGFGWTRGFLNRTRIGRWLMDGLWEGIRSDVIDLAGYRKEKALQHLEPPESLFWSGRVGIHNYTSDHHDLIRSGQVTLHHKDIAHLSSPGRLTFTDSSTLSTDALLAITGWQLNPTIQYLPPNLSSSLGIPSTNPSQSDLTLWSTLETKADAQILSQFPRLANHPVRKLPYTQPTTPYRLYRGLAPPNLTSANDHSLVYLKTVHCTSNTVLAEIQSLWTFAYLNNFPLKIPSSSEEIYYSTALHSRFGKWRYPWGFAQWYPEFVYDAVPYFDMLLHDLGLRRWGKKSWWREVWEGYTIRDYEGLVDEWKGKEVEVGRWRMGGGEKKME